MAKVRTGIIGCGGIANAKHMPALAAFPDRVEIVAFCDIVEERAIKAKEQYGTKDAKIYTNYKELLADPTIDDVHVLTPNNDHCQITVDAFAAGKHVLCEKPMAATSADAQKMMDAWKKSGKLFSIGYQNRYRKDSRTLKKLCLDGVLGDIYYAKARAIRRRSVPTWGVFPDKSKQGGGPLIDIGTHSLDMTLWMMDNYEPKSVRGVSFEKLGRTLKVGEQGNTMGPWDPDKYEVEDSAFGFIEMKNGAVIQLEAAWAINLLELGEAKTILCGTKAGADMIEGTLHDENRYDVLRINTVVNDTLTEMYPDVAPAKGVAFADTTTMQKIEQDFYTMNMDYVEMEAYLWLNAIEGKGELVVKPEQALVVTKILEAIYESSRTGELVKF